MVALDCKGLRVSPETGGAIPLQKVAAVHEKGTFTLTFPHGTTPEVSLGERASCYKGTVILSDWRHPARHLLAVSAELYRNGGVGRTMLPRYQQDEAWASLVSFLGLPAEQRRAHHILGVMEENDRIKEFEGMGCQRVLRSATTGEVLA